MSELLAADAPTARQRLASVRAWSLEARRLEMGDEAGPSAFRRSWCVGTEEFRQQMLQKMEGKLGEHHSGELHRESAQAKGRRLLAEELGRLGWTEEQLEARPKSDPAKLGNAARLRKETTLSIKAIAGLVHLGSSKGANTILHKWMQAPTPADPRQKQLGIMKRARSFLWVAPY